MTLTNPVNAKLGAKSVFTYTINDEDSFGAIKLSSAAYSVGEAVPRSRSRRGESAAAPAP